MFPLTIDYLHAQNLGFAIFAVFLMLGAGLVVITATTTQDTQAADVDEIAINDSRLRNQTDYWVTVEKTSSTGAWYTEYKVTYNEGDKTPCILNFTPNSSQPDYNYGRATIYVIGENFVIPANCGFRDSSGGSHLNNQTPQRPNSIYVNFGKETSDRLNLTVKGTISNVWVYALYGKMTIANGGLYDDGQAATGKAKSFFMRDINDEEGSSVVVEKGGLIRSANFFTDVGTDIQDTFAQVVVKDLTTVASSSNADPATIRCTSNDTLILENGFDYSMMYMIGREAGKLGFKDTSFSNGVYIDIEDYLGTIQVNGGFIDTRTIFIIDPAHPLEGRIVAVGNDVSIGINYTYYDDEDRLVSTKSYGGVWTNGKLDASYAFICVDFTEGIESLTFNVKTYYDDRYIATQFGKGYDLLSNITVNCEDGWEFTGWYYHDINGVEKKITDPSEHIFDETIVIYAKAKQVSSPQPVPPGPGPVPPQPTPSGDSSNNVIAIAGAVIIALVVLGLLALVYTSTKK